MLRDGRADARSGRSAGSFGQRYAIAARPDGGRHGPDGRPTRRAPGNDRGAGRASRSSAVDRRARSWRPGWRGAGVEVVLFERSPGLALARRRRLRVAGCRRGAARAGLDEATLAEPSHGRSRRCASRRRAGPTFRLTYGAETGGRPAVGFDRSRLDPALLDAGGRRPAPTSGRAGRSRDVDLGGGPPRRARPGRRDRRRSGASVIVGADGPHSVVARGGRRRRARPGSARGSA